MQSNFWGGSKKFGLAQNVLGPVKGQGNNLFNKSVNPHLEAALGSKSWLPFLRILQPDTHRNMEQMDL